MLAKVRLPELALVETEVSQTLRYDSDPVSHLVIGGHATSKARVQRSRCNFHYLSGGDSPFPPPGIGGMPTSQAERTPPGNLE